MVIFKKAADIHSFILKNKQANQSVGFVPTMGALHEGHISLINKCKSICSLTVCSIFVNPTQFNNSQDFEKYPITIEEDIVLLENAGCDVLFLPSVQEIYPDNYVAVHYELGYLESVLEGKYRPGHFQGVCMVVERLLHIIPCNTLFLGQKDYQQCMVIEKMIQLRKLNVQLHIAPTIRETDGLAMSSRNRRLSVIERKTSTCIYQILITLKNQIKSKPINLLIEEATKSLIKNGFEIDYIALTDCQLNPLDHISEENGVVALIAATINNVRLIDNMTLIEKNR